MKEKKNGTDKLQKEVNKMIKESGESITYERLGELLTKTLDKLHEHTLSSGELPNKTK